MRLHDLQPVPGSRHTRKRKGRGVGSGLGKTSTRGHKGQWARAGGGVRPGFEGGQTPLLRRVPKRGFTNAPFKKDWSIVNVGQLGRFASGTVVTLDLLVSERLVRNMRDGVKILGEGDLAVGLTVQAHAFTESAKEKIETAGGSAEVI